MSRFKSPWVAWLVIFTFSFTAVIGAHVWNPTPAFAWDIPDDQGHAGTKPTEPQETNCGEKDCTDQRSPVQIKQGNYVYSHTDLFIPGLGMPLEVTRHYDSQDMYDGPFGYGWKWGLEIKLIEITDESGDDVTIRRGDGTRREFTRNPDGSYSPPAGWKDYLGKNDDGTFTWCESSSGNASGGLGTCYDFDSAGYLTTIQDQNSNQMSFSYDGTGKLIQVTDASGRFLTIAYGANNKIATIKDPANRVFTYGYDASGNLTSYTDPLGNTTTYSYDAKHHLTKITDARGNTVTKITYYEDDDYKNDDGTYRLKEDLYRVKTYTEYGTTWTYTYDSERNTTYKEDNDGNTWTYTYNDHGQVLTERDPLWNTTTYVRDENLHPVSVRDPRGYTTTYKYDDNLHLISEKDPLGKTTTYTYNLTHDKVETITDPMGYVTKYEYDSKGNLSKLIRDYGGSLENETALAYNSDGTTKSRTDPLGNTTSFTYDTYGNLTTITNARGATTTMIYDILGNLIRITDALGHSTTFAYDDIQNLISVTDALGQKTTYSYDKNSNLQSIIDANGNTKRYAYNAYDQLTVITDPLNNATLITYGKSGYPITITDAQGKITAMEYDSLGRLAKGTDALGNSTQYSYDANSNLITIKDAEEHSTTFAYDGLNRPTKTVYSDGSIESYSYDSNGNQTSTKDANGNTVIYVYDRLGRLSQINYPNGLFEIFTYDKARNLLSRKDRKGNTIKYSYDNVNMLVSKTYPDGSKASYTYDVKGRLTTATTNSSTIAYIYDSIDRVTQTNQSGKKIAYEYDAVGNRSKLIYPDGNYITYRHNTLNLLDQIKNASDEIIADYTHNSLGHKTQLDLKNGTQSLLQYDMVNELSKLENKIKSSGSVISGFAYTRERMGNIMSMTTKQGTHAYNYDTRYQLVSTDYPDGYPFLDTNYSYDAAGNRTSVVNDQTLKYIVNNMNQYTDIGGVAHSYDNNGNLISDGVNTYKYDYENRLVQVTTPTATITNSYDAFGRRISKTVNGKTSLYIYDNEYVIEEFNASGEPIHYIYGSGIDQVLAMVKVNSGLEYFYHQDGLGSVRNITDSAGGIIESYYYDVYGKPHIRDGAGNPLEESLVGNPYMFTGRRFDNENKLYYYRARHYDPDDGRFLQEDLFHDAMDINQYTYAKNNPVNRIDPSGNLSHLAAVLLAVLTVVVGVSAYLAASNRDLVRSPSQIIQSARNRKHAVSMPQNLRARFGKDPAVQAELDEIERLVLALYLQPGKVQFQCNVGAKEAFKALYEELKLKHIDIRGAMYDNAITDPHDNFVALFPKGKTHGPDYVLIYFGTQDQRLWWYPEEEVTKKVNGKKVRIKLLRKLGTVKDIDKYLRDLNKP